ncbi:LysR family transcriptional regulator [Mesorhizobium australicum]|uniref:DNA-binding transcriptional regulator, LysR family n=1 Tax=Mesorhizobium australicum TaxID=536018 RepID=A0A1X7MRY3_9HYPH|nr:LysR family transcriptional regulator [Mesorhizobium australicum]SMH27590.1 DNA-binding transcriptional regulator, LysR family [Mesorhizobium australicum]
MNVEILRHLRYVRAAIACGSMRRAAQALGVQESTVSRHISAIEQLLEIQFFERHNNGVRLTNEGQLWIESVQDHYNSLEEALLQTARRNTDGEKLRIGLCVPIGLEFLLRLVDRFGATHPDIDVIFRDGSCANQATAIRRRHLDISFMCSCADIRSCRSEPIWEEGLSVLLPSNHRLAIRDTLTWEALAGEKLLVPLGPDGPQFDSSFLEHFVGGSHAPIVEQCHASQATVMIKVRLGKGFTLAGEGLAKAATVEGAVWRTIVGERSRCQLRAVWLDSNPKRAVLRLVATAQNMAAERKR